MSAPADQSFLGEEFLTWLWFHLETRGGDFALKDRSVGIAIDDFIAFAPHETDETEQSLRKGLPTRTVEARAALKAGHRLRRAKLVIAEGDQEWSLVIDGPTMDLLSIKIPEDDESASTPTDRNAGRIDGFLSAFEIVYEIYALFLQDRLRPDYLATAGTEQAQWMAG